MDLYLNESLGAVYKSRSQKIRVMSEKWIEENMYCPCCGNSYIKKLENNKPVSDFQCKQCNGIFELKSKKGRIGKKINDGAYLTMLDRITSITNPELFVMNYSKDYKVTDLIFIPKFFFIPAIIEKRKPLKPTAKRAGWVGCNILYDNIPVQGKIEIITDERLNSKAGVLNEYETIKKLQTNNIEDRGWLIDVLNCVNSISTKEFYLREMYNYTEELQQKHINNHNIEAKIRQQLQILRDKGFIEFLGNGHYRKIIS